MGMGEASQINVKALACLSCKKIPKDSQEAQTWEREDRFGLPGGRTCPACWQAMGYEPDDCCDDVE